ncbi:GIY-YIG nuclease family protein [Nocardia cyriacigeorgica]|uniref:GIY-YIG nuclease family protein n=1 Tax=Nocardia cyriacigeorgica TaxID=135487 RepID=A0A5R8PDD6_9NOCA|nr:GIY-YIG nuclease family protein [Nocardia cyriacigeorgica]MBF6095719.1 GIY-YIG nuclease family protein [Nocardia cyriacigeorgica]TLF73679.1 GIY-YIG nuclease family protein [Nocardia cyriacigeorgica]TLG10231.1 GIY-YIG nuclease family protein [Nocardia cyriacigeorgica]
MNRSAAWAGAGTHHGDFRLSITKALGDQLADALAALVAIPLTEENLNAGVDERPGVYQLYLDGEFVYVGKADKSLRDRLSQHLRKISGRRDIDLTRVTFSCLYVAEDFSALAPEQLLISHYKGKGGVPWNHNGFGNKDPGRQRDTTTLKDGHFDVKFPIDLDVPVLGLRTGKVTLDSFLKTLKSGLPYVFRYAVPPRSKLESLDVARADLTAHEAFRLVSATLPPSWQITALMGYVIMYEETQDYTSAWRYYRAGDVIHATPVSLPEEAGGVDALDFGEAAV